MFTGAQKLSNSALLSADTREEVMGRIRKEEGMGIVYKRGRLEHSFAYKIEMLMRNLTENRNADAIFLCRETMSSRVAASLIFAVTSPITVARNLEDYGFLARRLVGGKGRASRLGHVRERLRVDRFKAKLFDTRRLVHELEKGFKIAWEIGEKEEWGKVQIGMHQIVAGV